MTDRELLSELQYVLIEPPDGGDTWPSLIWTRPEVLDAVNAALRALVRATHMQIVRVELPVLARAVGVLLPANWLATAALVWRAADGTRTPLHPTDAFEGDLATPGWESTPGLPVGYRDLEGPMLTLQLLPTPAAAGTVELLYCAVPPLVTGQLPGALLPLAPEFASAAKYAALGTLLRKLGRLLDDERAQYCERRYQLTQVASSILLGGWA